MKKNEKIVILLLIVITIVLVVVVKQKGNKKEELVVNSGVASTSQNDTPEPVLNDVENESGEPDPVVEKNVSTMADGTRVNTSESLHETKKIDELEISEIQLTEKENKSVLLGTIKNTSSSTHEAFIAKIAFLDENGVTLISLPYYIEEIGAGESVQLNLSASFDYANAVNFTITK